MSAFSLQNFAVGGGGGGGGGGGLAPSYCTVCHGLFTLECFHHLLGVQLFACGRAVNNHWTGLVD